MTFLQRLSQATEAVAKGDWSAAYAAYSEADSSDESGDRLAPLELESYATCAYIVGYEDEFVRLMERAHNAHLDHGDVVRAARCAAWLALNLAAWGAAAPASGWTAISRRLLADVGAETVSHGYLKLAEALAAVVRGDLEGAAQFGSEAVAVGQRFSDADLASLALHLVGRVQLRLGAADEGFALIDEAMATVASRSASPVAVLVVYCGVIDACRSTLSWNRARAWSAALAAWCDRQAGMVSFFGECCVVRSEMLMIGGDLDAAETEARRARERLSRWTAARVQAAAAYQLGEVQLQRGDLPAAEAAFTEAVGLGGRAQPGLARLRLARGDAVGAQRSLAALLADTTDPIARARLLPWVVEACLAAGDPGDEARSRHVAEAEAASTELTAIASALGTSALMATAADAAGKVALAVGDAKRAATELFRALETWLELGAPGHAARTRFALAEALEMAGDVVTASAHRSAAAGGLRLAAPLASLSPREREVLTAVTEGAPNRAIAARLGISERTVERHVSNLLDKLGVRSRTEAATLALRSGLDGSR